MTYLRSARPRVSLLKKFTNFTNSSAGLEKTLRLIHALALVAAEICVDNVTITRCLIAQSQIALARRYFRLFCFVGCFERVYDLLTRDSSSGGTMLATLEVTKHSCLGLYSLLEDLTILHDMSIWIVPWYTPVLLEANKFWFYALCISIFTTVWELIFGSTAQNESEKDNSDIDRREEMVERPSSKPSSVTAPLVKLLVIDGCDIFLPGSLLGWIPVRDLGVGMAMVVSTVMASLDIWEEAQK